MLKTFRLSFSLKNTYRVNAILYSLKQIPLLKRLLPSSLYSSRGLKRFAAIPAALWEVITAFLGKALYLWCMIASLSGLYKSGLPQDLFVHLLFFLTFGGAFMNTYMFNPTNDKYYALFLMRMDARAYTLSNYLYAMLKTAVGFLPFTLLIGLQHSVPLWVCALCPFFIVGAKLCVSCLSLYRYERTGIAVNENIPGKKAWLLLALLLAAAYGLPAIGVCLPVYLFVPAALVTVCGGIAAAFKIYRFRHYRDMYLQLLMEKRNGMNQSELIKQMAQEQNRRLISTDASIGSRRKGFEYLNELFIKRHRKILWKSVEKLTAACLLLAAGILLLFQINTGAKEAVNKLLMSFLPYFVFVMYLINRGTAFTQALFMNCDRSMLTYSFYKQPKSILRLFRIRLREIIKVNLLPAAVIALSLPLFLYASGGTGDPIHYIVLPVSILCMSIFFSVHHLTAYYLLQPYNAETELKSGTYRIVMWLTYLACFFFMRLRINTLLFGALTIIFCIAYCVTACILVYLLAAKTFRLRQ